MDEARTSDRLARILPTLAALVCLGCVLWVGSGLVGIRDSVDTLIHQTKEALMQVKLTTWYSKINGVCVLQSVSTPKGGMSDEDWQAAHRRAVADMMADYPPSADCPTPR